MQHILSSFWELITVTELNGTFYRKEHGLSSPNIYMYTFGIICVHLVNMILNHVNIYI